MLNTLRLQSPDHIKVTWWNSEGLSTEETISPDIALRLEVKNSDEGKSFTFGKTSLLLHNSTLTQRKFPSFLTKK